MEKCYNKTNTDFKIFKINRLTGALLLCLLIPYSGLWAQQINIDELNKKELRANLIQELEAKDSVQNLLGEERKKNEQIQLHVTDLQKRVDKMSEELESRLQEVARLNQELKLKTQEYEVKALENKNLEQKIVDLSQTISEFQQRLENEEYTEEAEEVAPLAVYDQIAGQDNVQGGGAVRFGMIYRCTKTLFADNPEMIAFIRKRNPGYIDNTYSALQFPRNSNKVIGGTLAGNSRNLEDPEAASFVMNSSKQTLTITYPDKTAAVETYKIELNSAKNLVTALLLIGSNGAVTARYNLLVE